MSETLWAVIIGGIIAVIGGIVATIPTLVFNERRWKKEKKLEHLRAERRHKEEQYIQILSELPDFIEKGGDDRGILTRLFLVFPVDIGKELGSLLKQTEGKRLDRKAVYPQITSSVREILEDIDKEINKLMS